MLLYDSMSMTMSLTMTMTITMSKAIYIRLAHIGPLLVDPT